MISTSSSGEPNLDGWKRYAEDVLAQRIVVGEYVRKDVERFVDEIADDSLRWVFDVEEAVRFLSFIQTFTSHTRGEWAGRPFILSDWQANGTRAGPAGQEVMLNYLELEPYLGD